MTEPKEIIGADEAARFEAWGLELRAMQERRATSKGVAPHRALHLKHHFGAVGELVVNAGLDPAMAVGVFAEPRRWPLYARASNGGGRAMDDGVNQIRGLALKLVGVPGKKLIPGLEDKATQDLLFIQTPETAVRDPNEFMLVVRHAGKGPLALLGALIQHAGLRRTLAIVRANSRMKHVTSMATGTFYTAAPIRLGTGAAKLALFPMASDPPRGQGRDALRDDAIARLQEGPISYSLRAQLFVDEATTPIEDGAAPWSAARSPWRQLGTVTLFRQDLKSAAGQQIEALVETLSFDPWHAIEAHRPLGAMMRARAAAYKHSAMGRNAGDEPTEVLPPAG